MTGYKRNDSFLSEMSKIADSPETAAIIVNSHVANINKLLPPLQATDLPAYLSSRTLKAIVSEYEVYQHLKKIAKSKYVPDDIRKDSRENLLPSSLPPYATSWIAPVLKAWYLTYGSVLSQS